jgi:molybdenum cofactor biosynthesis enzyme MoaA
MTTNGVLLAANAGALKEAGLHRLTVSLDTLDAARFKALTRYDELDRVLAGIAEAAPLFPGLKIDTVVIRGVNDDELVRLIEFGRGYGAEVRFIEYMDVAAPRTGRWIACCRAARCWSGWARITARLLPSQSRRRRRRIDSVCPTARCSASSRPPPSRSATPATAAA